jgi:hypothetical protein
MSAPALARVGPPMLRIRGRSYPVFLPTLRDPRLHLASVIVSLQVLGQVALDFELSIAQIIVSLVTCAVLEVGIAFRRQRVILWPASALLTGNGVAFVLRVPGTEHGDWWSMNGWWIFAGTAAVALLSKYLVRFRGRHVFNPSNFGLVLCFLLLGAERADPLALWWGPMSPALALALAIIVVGGVTILRRLHLLGIAVVFWVTFAAGIGVLAASGHQMTAPWHVGPLTGLSFWWVLVSSPEILVFLFFMITDPKTIPDSRAGRHAYAAGVALLATVLIAPQVSEFATKVAILSALFLACAARPLALAVGSRGISGRLERLVRGGTAPASGARRATLGGLALAGAVAFAGVVALAGIPARPAEAGGAAVVEPSALPAVTIVAGDGIAPIGAATGRLIARDLVADLRAEEDALRRASAERAQDAATGAWLAELWQLVSRGPVDPPVHDVERMQITLERGDGQSPPVVVATLTGRWRTAASPVSESGGRPFRRTVRLVQQEGRYLISTSRGGAPAAGGAAPVAAPADDLGGVRLQDVAAAVGLDFRHDAFRFGVTNDPAAMMGGGLCWLDADDDGWLDLYVTNAYADADYPRWESRGGLPRSALFRNVKGRFVDISRGSGADLPLRASGCVAADFDRDGHSDLFVTTAGFNPATEGFDALLWGRGDGTFTEGARAAGIDTDGWHAGAAVGDVDGNGWPDLFVAGYTEVNTADPTSTKGFPGDRVGVRDRLFLNQGPGGSGGRPTFREVGAQVGIERGKLEHGLGAVFTDVNGDGRLDLYVANDTDPNRLYLNRPSSGPLGFRFEERSSHAGVADPNAGMGIAAQDFSRDGLVDLFVTNSRDQLHAAYRSLPGRAGAPAFTDARPGLATVFGTSLTGWGASWVDLDLDGDLDLVAANGAIPMLSIERDAQRVMALANVSERAGAVEFARVGASVGLSRSPRVNGRGLAAADFDNDGDVDVAVNSVSGPLVLLRSTGARGHWLQVRLPTFAPGARVTAVLPDGRRLVREVQAGSSYLSSEDPRVHFGLGDAGRVSALLVRYPDGRRVRLTDVAADRIVDIAR